MSVSLGFGLLARLYFHNLHYEKFTDGSVKCIEDEIPFELPEGWEWTRIRNISTVKGGKRLPKGMSFSETPTDHAYIRVTDMKNNTIITSDLRFIADDVYEKIKNYIISKDDLYVTIAGTIGVVGEVPDELDGMNLTENAVKITDITINKTFLCLLIQSEFVQQQFIDKTHQVAMPKLALERILSTLIPICSISEQSSIVSRFNALSVLVNDIQQNNQELIDTISLTKSKILDLAIRGKLVPQDPNDEPASVLLDRIRTEKEELIKQGKIKRDKKESVIFRGEDNSYYEKMGDEIRCIDNELPYSIPDNWTWCRLQNCCIKEIKRGKSPKYAKNSSVLVFAQKCNTKYDGININLALHLDESTLSKYSDDEYMQDKDIVINSTGTGTLGRVGIYNKSDNKKNIPIVPDSHVTVIRTNKAIDPIYAYYFLKANQHKLEKIGEGSTNQKELKPLTLKNLMIPLPSVLDQVHIVEKINALFEMLDSIEKSLN